MILRKLLFDDLKTRVEWMNNPKVYSSMHFEIPVLMENTIKWFENNLKNDHRSDVCFVENEVIMAFGGLTSIDYEVKKAELYVFVNPNVQRTGVGTQATKLLCKFGFEELHLHKIYLLTNEDNIGAIKVYQKCGFSLEGRHREEYFCNNEYKDRLYFGLLQKDLIL